MTFEELKAEANRQGYSLLKRVPRERFLPCSCGNNRRTEWLTTGGVVYECTRCGRRGPVGKNETEARRLWNMMIRSDKA